MPLSLLAFCSIEADIKSDCSLFKFSRSSRLLSWSATSGKWEPRIRAACCLLILLPILAKAKRGLKINIEKMMVAPAINE